MYLQDCCPVDYFLILVILYLCILWLLVLQGVKFDPQTGSSLHIDLARSNSRRKNKPGSMVFFYFFFFWEWGGGSCMLFFIFDESEGSDYFISVYWHSDRNCFHSQEVGLILLLTNELNLQMMRMKHQVMMVIFVQLSLFFLLPLNRIERRQS